MSSYADKYQAGAITNSMLEAAESCELKFWVLYLERAKLFSRFEKVLDAMSLGILVHEILESFPETMGRTSPVEAVLMKIADWKLDDMQILLLPKYLKALDMTRADGLTKGKTYTAPTWTSYWKQHYSGLDAEIEQFNRNLQHPTWLCDIEPMTFLLRAVTCVQNYKDLLPEIKAGFVFQAAEKTFHTQFDGQVLAGTVDRTDMDPLTQGLVITDYKTGTKKYDAHILHNLNQLNLYALAERTAGQAVTGLRVVSLERKEIIYAPFKEDAHRIFIENRLPRLIHHVNTLRETPKELLSVLAGRSFDIGCPCALSRLKADDPNRCTAVWLEDRNG